MNILILCGSPHREGTSNTLVKEFIRGAEGAGTVGMMPESYYAEAYQLGKSI